MTGQVLGVERYNRVAAHREREGSWPLPEGHDCASALTGCRRSTAADVTVCN